MIGNRIIRLKETESTNRYASELLTNHHPLDEGTVIVAYHQSAGRGTGDNKWESEKGKNLTLSIVLYPSFLPIKKQFMMNKVVSLGVFDMITKLIEGKGIVKIKWPNDIYVNNKKISGSLIENTILGANFQHFIIGIGININQQVFASDAPNPVSLKNLTGKEFDLDDCLSILFSYLNSRYLQLKNSDEKHLDEDYLSVLFGMGEIASYIHKGQTIHARITGINEQGKLLLDKTDGHKLECDFKEIEFII